MSPLPASSHGRAGAEGTLSLIAVSGLSNVRALLPLVSLSFVTPDSGMQSERAP